MENDEYAVFVRRILRAYSRRVASGDIEAITEMAAIAAEMDTALRDAITGLRAHGYSWADIAVRLGITRQGASSAALGLNPSTATRRATSPGHRRPGIRNTHHA